MKRANSSRSAAAPLDGEVSIDRVHDRAAECGAAIARVALQSAVRAERE